ncbi:MAG: ribose-phosphate diphosphokinase [Oscillospiraceae bacterium]|nr:ribose-phosphate diphosphokinase [Oscillospiraceae bacterium]
MDIVDTEEEIVFQNDDFSTFGKLGVIAMKGCKEIGEKINRYLIDFRFGAEADYLVKASCPRFTTGEAKALIEQSVRGYDIFIICDCYNHSETFNIFDKTVYMSPDDHYRDLIRTIAALRGSKARRINVIMPMLYSSRQDNRYDRESLDCAISLQELVDMGVSNVLTFDAHEPRVQNAIPLNGFETVRPSYQMIKAMYNNVEDIKLTRDRTIIISPDEGGVSRCLSYSTVLGLDIAMFYKRRDYSKFEKGRSPIVSHDFLGKDEDVAGKDVIIIDDILASGDSILDVARPLRDMGAKRIFVFITFGQFTGGSAIFDKAYEEGVIEKIFVTNTTYKSEEIKSKPWFCDVDISKYLAKLIDALNCDHSLSNLLTPINRIRALKEEQENQTRIK